MRMNKHRHGTERKAAKKADEHIRLNKFIATSGLCSRRDADALIEEGVVEVNGEKATELGAKVWTSDVVLVNGKRIFPDTPTYILMHKPKNTITTTDDERDRTSVIDLLEKQVKARVYPVGRLDRNTTGVLLLTNDGDLANRLTHPSYSVEKVYTVSASLAFSESQIKQLLNGVELEDGLAKAVWVEFVNPDQKNHLRICVHEGRNHLVRRMVAAVNNEVIHLKRTLFAGLNVRSLPPSKWRFMREKEINGLRKKVQLKPIRLQNSRTK